MVKSEDGPYIVLGNKAELIKKVRTIIVDDYLELSRARRGAAAANTHRKSAIPSGA